MDKKKSKATESDLNDIHQITTRILIAQLKAFEANMLVEDDRGQWTQVAPLALLDQATKFLKANGIQGADRDDNPLSDLKRKAALVSLPTEEDFKQEFASSRLHN